MSAVLLPCSASAAGRRVYAARLGAPAPLVARARGAFSNTTVECVALVGGEGQQPKSPTRGGAPAPAGPCGLAGGAASPAAAAGPPAADPHEGLTLNELLPHAAHKDKDGPGGRICVRAIGLGYGKDAQLARAWRDHCRGRGGGGRRSGGPQEGGGGGAGAGAGGLLSADLPHLEGAFIRCEPEVTAHALAPGDAAVVLASAALRAALPPVELALLAHGFDARRLRALRLAYTSGKAPPPAEHVQGLAAAAVPGWSGVDDCAGARLAFAPSASSSSACRGGAAAAAAAAAAKGVGGPAATGAGGASIDLARLPRVLEAPPAPHGEPNAARILVHMARARLLAAANNRAAAAAGGASLAVGRPALPKLLAKRAAAQPLVADDATRLDLAVDGEEMLALAEALEGQGQQQQQRQKRKKAAAAPASFNDGADFAAGPPVLAMPPGYGAVPPAAAGLNGRAKEVEEAVDDAQRGDGAQGGQRAEQTAAAAQAAPRCCCTKRDVHGDLAAVVLALEWGEGGGGGASRSGGTTTAASTDRPIPHPAASAASLSGCAAAVQAALAAGARSSRPAALYRWELVRLAVKARCARRRQLRAAWWAAADALRRAADAAARRAEVAAWRVLGEAVHVTRDGGVVASAAAPASAAAGGASGARAVVMLGMGGSAKGPAASAASAAHALRRHRASPLPPSASASPLPSPSPSGRRVR